MFEKLMENKIVLGVVGIGAIAGIAYFAKKKGYLSFLPFGSLPASSLAGWGNPYYDAFDNMPDALDVNTWYDETGSPVHNIPSVDKNTQPITELPFTPDSSDLIHSSQTGWEYEEFFDERLMSTKEAGTMSGINGCGYSHNPRVRWPKGVKPQGSSSYKPRTFDSSGRLISRGGVAFRG